MDRTSQAQFPVSRVNTILYCRRWAATVDFYRHLLGLQVSFENDWFVEFHVGSAGYLSIADAARATVGDTDGQGITLSWQVDDVEKIRGFLIERGVDCLPATMRWGSRVVYLHDPEGHRIELWEPEVG